MAMLKLLNTEAKKATQTSLDGLFEIARAARGLLYGLKYSKEQGLSVAEAIEVGLKAAGEAIASGVRDGAETIAEALSELRAK
jgi:hypothetical protein